MIKVLFQKLHPQAQLPTRGSTEAAGFDLKATQDMVIPPRETRIVGTGLRMKMEHHFAPETVGGDDFVIVASVRSRSGLAAQSGVFVLNSPGTIDQDYRGEIKVILHNTSDQSYRIFTGDRIAQMTFGFTPIPQMELVNELPIDTDRGEGGLGSTGVSS